MMQGAFKQIILIVLTMVLLPLQAWGQSASQQTPVNIEYLEREDIDSRLTAYDNNLLGDSLDLKTGTLSFDHTDVSIPGNFGLEVAIRRTRGADYAYETSNASHFGDWALEVPHITMIVEAGTLRGAAQIGVPPDHASDLCEEFVTYPVSVLPPDADLGLSQGTNENPNPFVLSAYEYSNGLNLKIPGAGSQQLLTNPQGITWPKDTKFVTTSHWAVKCITRGDGESGFEATAPNGTVYTFDNYTYRHARPMHVGEGSLFRGHAIYQATKVEDVHGNTVDFTYDGDGHLLEVSSSDGRKITLTHTVNDDLPNLPNKQITRISTTDNVSNHHRSWKYDYAGTQGIFLEKVTLPDGNFWEFDIAATLSTITDPSDCPTRSYPTPVSTVKHPYGTTGVFTAKATKHLKYGEATAMKRCQGQTTHQVNHYWAWSLDSKVLSGSNLPTSTWTYDYSELSGGTWGEMINPLGHKTRTTYHGVNSNFSGFEIKTEVFETASSSTPLQKTEYDYVFEEPLGETYLEETNPYTLTRPRHKIETKTTQDGNSYTTEYNYQLNQTANDYAYGNPRSVSQNSDVDGSEQARETLTSYKHETDKWILGLTETVRERAGGVTRLVSTYSYDPNGQIINANRYGEDIAKYNYNNNGTLNWMEDGLNRKTTATLWHRGKPKKVTRHDGTFIERGVNDNGWIMSQTDARDYTTSYVRDDTGRLTRIFPSNVLKNQAQTNIQTLFFPDRVEHFIDKGWERQYTKYDNLLRPIEEIRVARPRPGTLPIPNKVVTTQYDGLGRVTFKSLPFETANLTQGTEFTYDALGRVTKEKSTIDGDIETSYKYLPNNCTEVTDAENNVTTTCKNGYGGPGGGDVVKITQPEGIVTTMTYNGFGELEHTAQTGSQNTQDYYYDAQRRLCRYTTPESGSTLYAYDEAGQVIAYVKGVTDGSDSCPASLNAYPSRVTMTYDDLGRLKTTNFADSGTPDIWRDYDENGNLIRIDRGPTGQDYCRTTDGANCWFYEYDEYNRLYAEDLQIDHHSFETKYTYDPYGYLIRKVLPTGRHIPIINDHIGRTLLIGFSGDRFADTFQYHVNDQLKRFNYGNGQIYQSQQNSLQQTSRVFVQKPGTAWAVDLTYSYDDLGRVLTVDDGRDATNDRSYTYDGVGRLKTANSPLWGDASYSYDAMGNLLTKNFTNWNGATRSVTNTYAPVTNRLTKTVDSLSGTRLVKYDNEMQTDKRGNITTLGGLGFTYDLADQPITLSGTSTGTHEYDGNLKRVKSTVNGVIRYNVYDAAGMLVYVEEEDDPNTPEDDYSETEYLHASGMTIARIRTSADGNGVFTYMHPDHLGSPKAGSKEDGTISFTEQYTPFGESLLSPAANDNQSGFTGHIKDADTGLNYMQARYYDPNVGRFLSIDPVTFLDTGEPGYFNRYVYAFNNPITNFDPTGMSCESLGDGCTFGPRNPETGEFTFVEQKQFSAETTEGIAFGGEKISEMAGTVGLGTTRLASEAKVGTTKALGKVGQSLFVGSKTTKAIGGSADDFIAANTSRLNSKLGKKLGDGRLPFAMGKEGFNEAVSTVRNTLSSPSRISGKFTTRGGDVARDIFSKKTGFTVRVRAGGEFDTLIPELSSKF